MRVPLYEGFLRFQLKDIIIKTASGSVVGTVQTLAYDGIVPGPLIEFKACTQYKLTFINEAPEGVSDIVIGGKPSQVRYTVHWSFSM